jgi:hypothetical protein
MPKRKYSTAKTHATKRQQFDDDPITLAQFLRAVEPLTEQEPRTQTYTEWTETTSVSIGEVVPIIIEYERRMDVLKRLLDKARAKK